MRKLIGILTFTIITLSASAQIKLGCERIGLYMPQLKGKKIAVCANQTSMIGDKHLVDLLVESNFNVVAIYCPEHGFRGEAEAGANIRSSIDDKTGIPIISLYGDNKKPSIKPKSIDVIVFDLQDVGCRFYTYISTLHYIMEAAAENDIEVMVLDRPNPNGYFVDGPVLQEKYKSFVGMHPVPIVHGMTLCEYAKMINGEGWLANHLKCKLITISMTGYTHAMRYSLPIAPSPNLQSDKAVYLYPSLCLFEGTAISVGRGTDTPFEIYGAPALSYGDYQFTPQPIKGVSENPPYKNQTCRGENLAQYALTHLATDNRLNLSFILRAYQNFQNKENFFNNNNFFNKLAGNDQLQQQIIKRLTEEEIRQSWEPELSNYKQIRKKYLLYPDFQ